MAAVLYNADTVRSMGSPHPSPGEPAKADKAVEEFPAEYTVAPETNKVLQNSDKFSGPIRRPLDSAETGGAYELDHAAITAFERDGFVCVRGAFDTETAKAGAEFLYDAVREDHPGFDPDNPATYPGPKYLHPGSGAPPFAKAAASLAVAAACDQLIGVGRWIPRTGLGAFPIRFPHPQSAHDDGWHIDASIPVPGDDRRHANVATRNRALLSLWLFTNITEDDAPTRIQVGSHLRVAAYLAAFGASGVSGQLPSHVLENSDLDVVTATGQAGDVYLCHPFLVHAAGSHPKSPRIIAQPGIAHDQGCGTWREDGEYSPVERAIRTGITNAGFDIPRIAPQPRII